MLRRFAPRNDDRSDGGRVGSETTGFAQMNAPVAPEAFAERRPAGHPPVKNGQVGVLLVNLGTPEATDYWSMRRYLDEFLSDRRVIETPRWLWWPILNLAILTRRPGAAWCGWHAATPSPTS